VTDWPSTRAKSVLAALIRIGWELERQTGSHRVLTRPSYSPASTRTYNLALRAQPLQELVQRETHTLGQSAESA
jgi:hypothetical protein